MGNYEMARIMSEKLKAGHKIVEEKGNVIKFDDGTYISFAKDSDVTGCSYTNTDPQKDVSSGYAFYINKDQSVNFASYRSGSEEVGTFAISNNQPGINFAEGGFRETDNNTGSSFVSSRADIELSNE